MSFEQPKFEMGPVQKKETTENQERELNKEKKENKIENLPVFDDKGKEIGTIGGRTKDLDFNPEKAVMTFPPNKTEFFNKDGDRVDKPEDFLYSYEPHEPARLSKEK